MSFNYFVLLNVIIFVLCLIMLLFFYKAKTLDIVKIMVPAILASLSLFFTGLWLTNTSTVVNQEMLATSLNFGVASYYLPVI